MSWPFDTSEPFVTPEQLVAYQRQQRGLAPEQDAYPATLVATFQASAYQHLLQRAAVQEQPAGTQTQAPAGSTIGDRAAGAIDGVPVRLARISVGAPAAALVLEHAIARGVRNVLVVGSAGSLQRHLPIGTTVLVERAEREDGTSHHYLPVGEVVSADLDLIACLEAALVARGAAPVHGRSWTIDAPYRETVGAIRRHREASVAVVEMEAAAIYAVAKVRGARAALVVAVSDELHDTWNPGFAHPSYLEALTRAADAALDVAAQLAWLSPEHSAIAVPVRRKG